MPEGRLQDRVALVTGAGAGIGAGIARVLAREGARVGSALANGGGMLGCSSGQSPSAAAASSNCFRTARRDVPPSESRLSTEASHWKTSFTSSPKACSNSGA